MITYKQWSKWDSRGRLICYTGKFLFGFIPLRIVRGDINTPALGEHPSVDKSYMAGYLAGFHERTASKTATITWY